MEWRRYLKPDLCKKWRTVNSGDVFVLRMRRMFSLRRTVESRSIGPVYDESSDQISGGAFRWARLLDAPPMVHSRTTSFALLSSRRDELGVAEVILASPRQELELPNEHGLQPHALGHFRLGESRSPSSAFRLWKVGEGVFSEFELFEANR